jgi:hypothetical protein
VIFDLHSYLKLRLKQRQPSRMLPPHSKMDSNHDQIENPCTYHVIPQLVDKHYSVIFPISIFKIFRSKRIYPSMMTSTNEQCIMERTYVIFIHIDTQSSSILFSLSVYNNSTTTPPLHAVIEFLNLQFKYWREF